MGEYVYLLIVLLCIAALLLIAALITSYVCFYRIFYSGKRQKDWDSKVIPIPEGAIYEVYRDNMISWVKETRELPHTDVSITSFDGLTLRGRYYEHKKGAPIEIMFHGYKGTAERDMSAGVLRCKKLGRSALIVNHRASGTSDGKVITFGVNESRDCLAWIDYVINNIDKDARIILTGISMGAATVMIAAGEDLPKNVVGVLADCGYTSAKDIIKKVIKEMGLPAELLYPFARLGARIFGGFRLEERSPIEALKKAKVPVIFIHGDTDDFVPCDMSERNYEACVSQKSLVIINGAGHGICYPVDPDNYLTALKEFFDSILDR